MKTVVLGKEYDELLASAIKSVFTSAGARLLDQLSGVAGSQEVTIMNFLIEGRPVRLERETYMGISITGDNDLVDRLADAVRQQLVHAQK